MKKSRMLFLTWGDVIKGMVQGCVTHSELQRGLFCLSSKTGNCRLPVGIRGFISGRLGEKFSERTYKHYVRKLNSALISAERTGRIAWPKNVEDVVPAWGELLVIAGYEPFPEGMRDRHLALQHMKKQGIVLP